MKNEKLEEKKEKKEGMKTFLNRKVCLSLTAVLLQLFSHISYRDSELHYRFLFEVLSLSMNL